MVKRSRAGSIDETGSDGPNSRDVRSPSLLTCCAAVGQTLTGALRPRRADRGFLRSLRDAGLPQARETVTVRALPQSPRTVPTAFIVEGRRTPRTVENAMTTFMVEHPRARFLVDPSICEDPIRRAVAQVPAALRIAIKPGPGTRSTVQSMADVGVSAGDIDFAVSTHLHWDHVSGLLDLPDVPLRVHTTEHTWATTGAVAPVGGVRDALRGREIETFDLDGPPVSTFLRSHDLFGDGSVVMVDLSGHTPGQVGVLLNTAAGRVLLGGDAAWHSYQITDIRQKPGYPGLLVDTDRQATFEMLHRLHAVRDQVCVVPAHDPVAARKIA